MCPPSESVLPPSEPPIVVGYKPCGYRLDASSFYKCVLSASEENGFLFFSKDIKSFAHKRLYVRRSYVDIALQIEREKKSILTGTPGTGKSLFMLYLLWRLVRNNRRVLFVYHPEIVYYDGRGGVCGMYTLPHVSDKDFWTHDLWCLFDAKEKFTDDLMRTNFDACRFVLATAPRHELVKGFLNFSPVTHIFYMPVWKEGELAAIADSFPQAANWRYRFEILGGIPRYIFEDIEQHPLQVLKSACCRYELDDLIRIDDSVSCVRGRENSILSLVHIISKSPYRKAYVDFASPTALRMVFKYNFYQIRHSLSRFPKKWNRLVDILRARALELYPAE